jgi:hypothetical protein
MRALGSLRKGLNNPPSLSSPENNFTMNWLFWTQMIAQ